ncbi:uncharacterized protein LOC133419145 [Cololabis saira]|uniref:uncharacterized protein LOC133419145 n=1 Tax=Cololabis saira TaxID=129043 RepID=UPI002AD25ABA|nr:uncharacterized protein LOC133419145 [Cololabis saira]
MDMSKKKIGSGTTCAVVGCTNSRRRLNTWFDRECYEHRPATKRQCPCAPLFRFFRKPDTDWESRTWLKALNLKNPPRNIYVCSHHFVEKKPSKNHPFPKLWLGYNPSPQPKKPTKGTAASPQRKKRRHDSVVMRSHLKRLKTEDEPPGFEWSIWGEDESATTLLGRENTGPDVEAATQVWREHGYHSSRPLPQRALNGAMGRMQDLEELVSGLGVAGHLLDRWCVSDEDFKHFTKFPSKNIFFVFWKCVEPSASMIEFWSKANIIGNTALGKDAVRPSRERKLPLVDEFFMFCLHVAVGMREQVLSGMFGVSTSTVNRILIIWSNYLYHVLGTVQIWMTREQVTRTMPVKVQNGCPNVRAIVGCVEFECESSETTTFQSEKLSNQKTCTKFKALIGVAPCGSITFASKLFTSSISDMELTRQSGILNLLEPGDELVADKDFVIGDLLLDVGAKLIMPPSKHKDDFSKVDHDRAQAIAQLGILFEKVIRRIKEYQIWDSPLPLTLAGRMNQMWSCCCVMVNYQGSVDHDVPIDEHLYAKFAEEGHLFSNSPQKDG